MITPEEAVKNHFTCNCHEMYTSRKKADPDCVLHYWGPEIELIAQEYARQFALQVAGDAFDVGYYRRFFEFGDTDEDESNYPSKDQYLSSLQLPEQQGWMKYPENKPEECGWYLCISTFNPRPVVAEFYESVGEFKFSNDITYFQPLPPSPPITKQ